MAGTGRERGPGWLRGALVAFAVAAVTGLFSRWAGFGRPKLSAVSLVGVAVMLLGLAAVLLAGPIAERMRSRKVYAEPAVKLAGLLVCGIGAAMVFLGSS
ncbi:MAG: hypothetical protein IJH38_02405 [Clostridia bacterium]|nr:hypothetical protein [Clostridia bacterium]